MQPMNRLPFVNCLIVLILLWLFSYGCSPSMVIREVHGTAGFEADLLAKKIVKVHMRDGGLYLLDSLITRNNPDTVSGYGSYYDKYRNMIKYNLGKNGHHIPPEFTFPLSDVSLFETNNIKGLNDKVLAMTVVGVPTALVSVFCMFNPKACFGSCPTFYAWDGEDTTLMAEGFSSSILRSFEKKDVDMLYHANVTDNKFCLKVTN